MAVPPLAVSAPRAGQSAVDAQRSPVKAPANATRPEENLEPLSAGTTFDMGGFSLSACLPSGRGMADRFRGTARPRAPPAPRPRLLLAKGRDACHRTHNPAGGH